MIHFSFFSQESYNVVVDLLKVLNLGKLYHVSMVELESGYEYTAYYYMVTYPPLLEEMCTEYGEAKVIYGENEWGFPLYWDVWW